jgi:hypothetical protein
MTAALLCSGCTGAANQQRLEVKSATVDGTSFRMAAADGRVLRSADLVGAVIGVRLHGSEQRIRIDAIAADPADPALLLHSISIEQPGKGWQPLCQVAPDRTRAAYPIAGRSASDGTLAASGDGDIEIVCTSGAQGKCLRLGYRPWARLPDGSAMLPAFNACVRMMRADYAGRGTPETRDGTLVYVSDKLGIRSPELNNHLEFEAGWDEHGAVCVRHPRVKGLASLEQIAASSPRLAGRVGPACTRAAAEALGAVIFNNSRV